MKQTRNKLNEDAQRDATVTNSQEAAREFATPEELLRFDASQTPVPPEVALRLQVSVGSHLPPPKSWWRRLFKP